MMLSYAVIGACLISYAIGMFIGHYIGARKMDERWRARMQRVEKAGSR